MDEEAKEHKVDALIQEIQSMGPADKRAILTYVADLGEKPEPRMARTMGRVAEILGLEWRDNAPMDHPYGAQLDGQLWKVRIPGQGGHDSETIPIAIPK